MIDIAGDRAAIFADPWGFAVPATYMEAGIPPGVAVRVLRQTPDGLSEFGGARVVQAALTISVMLVDAPRLRKDDRFRIGDDTFIVQAAPLKDVEGLTWSVDLRPA